MFYHDGGKLQYEVKVDNPNPVFAKSLQQAIGGDTRGNPSMPPVSFSGIWGTGPKKIPGYAVGNRNGGNRAIEMLATAVALNLEGAPVNLQEAAAKDPIVHAAMGGMNIQHVITTCMAAMPVDSNGVPFNCSHVYASGNIAADMLANVTAESTGRMLAVQLYKMTDDKEMKNMLSFLIARDTMHQNQWLAAWEELGGPENHPIPNNFDQSIEPEDYNYTFYTLHEDKEEGPNGRWSSGISFDKKGEFEQKPMEPAAGVPVLGMADPSAAVQKAQEGDNATSVDDAMGQL